VTTLTALGYLGMYTRPLGIPLVYTSDALSGGAQFKGTLENGWYEHNPDLGAPFGQNLHDFPTADNLQFVFARFFGIFTDQWAVAYNLTYLATFPLTAMAAFWFIRLLGGSRLVAFAFALLYAFTPSHFIHGQPHLSLSMNVVVPLFAGLVMKVLAGRTLWPRRQSGKAWNPLTWATPGTLGTLAILAVTGTTSSYYSVFGLILMTTAVGLTLLRRRWRRVVGAVVAMGGLVFVMLVNMAPDILYARSMPTSPAAVARQPFESEMYSLKLASLLFPAPWHPIAALSRFRLHYDATFPNPGESPTLGIVAVVGFVYLLALPLVLAFLRRPLTEHGPLGMQQRHLALLTLVAFLFGDRGGLGTVFALFVSSDIRAWNRIVVYLALFSLASVALLVDALLPRLSARLTRYRARAADDASRSRLARLVTPAPVFGVVLVLAIGAVGIWDEAAPPSWTASVSNARGDWSNDEAYVKAVEQAVPSGTMIFELPVMQYPESLPIWDVQDYDEIRPYLHSHGLEWSYGGLKGRPQSDWQPPIAALPVLRMAVALAASGFGGIHLDRYGYPDHDPGELEQYLTELTGPPIESPDGRWAFFDLTDLKAEVQSDYSSSEIAQITRHTIRQPAFYWQQGFVAPLAPDGTGHLVLTGKSAAPRGVIDNAGGSIPMKLTFTIRAIDAERYPADVVVTWPDGKQQTVSVDADGTEVSHSWTVQHGQHSFTVAGSDMERIDLADLALRDPALYFPLRGTAADLAAQHADDRADDRADEKADELPDKQAQQG
jgi:phosphoglycerol transferase